MLRNPQTYISMLNFSLFKQFSSSSHFPPPTIHPIHFCIQVGRGRFLSAFGVLVSVSRSMSWARREENEGKKKIHVVGIGVRCDSVFPNTSLSISLIPFPDVRRFLDFRFFLSQRFPFSSFAVLSFVVAIIVKQSGDEEEKAVYGWRVWWWESHWVQRCCGKAARKLWKWVESFVFWMKFIQWMFNLLYEIVVIFKQLLSRL